jgi:hypothetical protein
MIASQNRGPLQVYNLKYQTTIIPFAADDTYAIITFKNGAKQKVENYYGSSFLSQSARFLSIGNNSKSVVVTNAKGQQRNVYTK